MSSAVAERRPSAQRDDDPTLELLDRLDDESQWKVLRNVPVFRAHRRKVKGADGSDREVVVTDDTLRQIARRAERRMKTSGEVPVVTLGHRLQGAAEPEENQPPVVGYVKAMRVGKFGPGKVVGLLADLYIRPEDWERARKYPFRSAEYYPNTGECTGVAMLRRDPMLDLGMLAYDNSGRGPCLLYGMEGGDGDDDEDDRKGGPTDALPGEKEPPEKLDDGDGTDDMTEDEKSKAYAYMCKKYAGLREWIEGRKKPGAPVPAPDREEMSPHQRGDGAVQYQRLQREHNQLKAKHDRVEAETKQLRQQVDELSYQRDVANIRAHEVQILLDEGVMIPDPEREARRLARMKPDDREERVAELRTYYQRDPAKGPMVLTASPGNADPNVITERHTEHALAYMRQHNCDWDAAVEKTRGK